MKVKFLLSEKAKELGYKPVYQKKGDAGIDLIFSELKTDDEGRQYICFGVAVEIPDGWVGKLYPRSSAVKTGIKFGNTTGIIDSGYRGFIRGYLDTYIWGNELRYFLIRGGEELQSFSIGDRIAQLLIEPCPQHEIEIVDELSSSDRGDKGFGSTGNT